jgi:hypothetical protein
MARQLTMRGRIGLWVGLPALTGAVAALALPGTTSAATAEAAMLAVGALALLAGHTWGILVVVTSHVPLVGRVWPALAGAPDTASAGAVAIVLVTALPTILLAWQLLPRVIEQVLPGRSARARGLVTAAMAAGLFASLVLPAAV